MLDEAIFEGMLLGSVAFMIAHAKRAEEVTKLSDARLEKLLDEYFAPAIDKTVKRHAKTVVSDLKRELKTWESAVSAKASTQRKRNTTAKAKVKKQS